MKYYLIAGEASGDLHASNLMKALSQEDATASFRCWGGDLMQQAGGDLVKHYRDLAFMGFWEVVKNLRAIRKNFAFCKKDIAEYQPDVLILIDYSGFNLRIAKWAKTAGFKIFYYISPQVWASRQSRVHKIKKYVDKLFVILPFEKDFYQQFEMEVDFVGHPLLDAIADFQSNNPIINPSLALELINSGVPYKVLSFLRCFSPAGRGQGVNFKKFFKKTPRVSSPQPPPEGKMPRANSKNCTNPQNTNILKIEPINPPPAPLQRGKLTTKPIIALLPGSRKQEIKAVLKIMLGIVKYFPAYQLVIAIAPAIPLSFYQQIIQTANLPKAAIQFSQNQTYALLNQAKAALVTSGTATLETALFEVPQVVCYKGNWLTYQIVKRIIKVPYISLVNLIANRAVVKELIQYELTPTNLKEELSLILKEEKRIEFKAAYQQIKQQLGNAGASKRAAKLMVQYLFEI